MENAKLEKLNAEQADTIAKLQRSSGQQTSALEKARETIERRDTQIMNLERELASFRKVSSLKMFIVTLFGPCIQEADKVAVLEKKLSADGGSQHVRLNRALEEVAFFRFGSGVGW